MSAAFDRGARRDVDFVRASKLMRHAFSDRASMPCARASDRDSRIRRIQTCAWLALVDPRAPAITRSCALVGVHLENREDEDLTRLHTLLYFRAQERNLRRRCEWHDLTRGALRPEIAYLPIVESPPSRKAAQGQYRTTATDFTKVPPYVRFRYERAVELLPAEGHVVELGCGVGVGLSHLARRRPDLSFRGVDMSREAIEYGRHHFGDIPNLRLEVQPAELTELARGIESGTFLVALEVLEHLDDTTLHLFKTQVMAKIDGAVFSFPYNQQNIQGTDHLQSFDIYDIFEMFPGFETIFIRRKSIKFIGYWRRQTRTHVREHLGVAGEGDAIARIANLDGPVAPRRGLVDRLKEYGARAIQRVRN